MSALADCMQALMRICEAESPKDMLIEARDVLRQRAPCGRCQGSGNEPAGEGERYFRMSCSECHMLGWTTNSVESAIKREEERGRLNAAVIEAAKAWDNASDRRWAKEAEALSGAVRAHREGIEQ